ncbi:hypothetical protein E3N88_24282 [Mikania micrantha]|uniref:Reverse transcriptase domain-containing protein n=1 Tax=Mikania micrantha TaxID=192012 RepID=A0A5N6NFK6_9ASTR|nr:hypothetical protein E3N88_24282 [Mikania micrantha]
MVKCTDGVEKERLKNTYKEAKRQAKKTVAEAKDKAYREMYKFHETKEGEHVMFKIAKARERKRQDIGLVRFIKGEDGRVLVKEKDIRERWQTYFSELFNNTDNAEGSEHLTNGETQRNNCYYRCVTKEEVQRELRKMRKAKEVGPDNIPIEVWICLQDEGISWLTTFFNTIIKTGKMPDQWRISVLVPLYKNKGDAQCCTNYRGIKLLFHTMKFWERVIETRLRRENQVTENQFGFMPGRSTTEATHILRRMMESYREKKRDLHMVFIDLEKAYDSVPRQVICDSLERRSIPWTYIEVGLHQGSALSPFLFAVILDELSRSIQQDIPWCMLYADDIVLMVENKEDLNARLEEWRFALESKGLRISRSKTEYLYCNFSGSVDDDNHLTIGDQEVSKTARFKYMGSFVQRDGDVDCDVAHRVQAGWNRWRAATSIQCDKRFPEKLKGKFYKVVVRPAMMYGSDCWPIKKIQARKLETTEMRMLRWMSGHTRINRIRNEVIRERLGVACISDKVREGRLRWFGNVKRRDLTAPVRRVENLTVVGKRYRGRPRLTCEKTDSPGFIRIAPL